MKKLTRSDREFCVANGYVSPAWVLAKVRKGDGWWDADDVLRDAIVDAGAEPLWRSWDEYFYTPVSAMEAAKRQLGKRLLVQDVLPWRDER